MSKERLARVMWRIRVRNPNMLKVSNDELRKAIMLELGTDPHTLVNNRKALVTLGWIRKEGPRSIRLTNADITGERY
jgi:hypothetical protein